MEFKTSEALFNKIKEDLYSFDAAGLLDEGKFHKDVQYVLTVLGALWFEDASEMLTISKYQACIPENFKFVDAIYRCNTCGINPVPVPDGIVFSELTFSHYPETQVPDWHAVSPCGSCGTLTCCPTGYTYDENTKRCVGTQNANVAPIQCDPCQDYWGQDPSKIFDVHRQLLIQRSGLLYTYAPPILMRPGNVNTRKLCSKGCANTYSQSPDTFTIQNRKLYVNFEDGEVLLKYKAFPIDEETELPMIPDDVIIEKAIEDYIKYQIIKNMRTNGDANVAQLIPLYRADMDESMSKAISHTKTPTFSTMTHNVRLVRKRFNVYQFPQMNGH